MSTLGFKVRDSEPLAMSDGAVVVPFSDQLARMLEIHQRYASARLEPLAERIGRLEVRDEQQLRIAIQLQNSLNLAWESIQKSFSKDAGLLRDSAASLDGMLTGFRQLVEDQANAVDQQIAKFKPLEEREP